MRSKSIDTPEVRELGRKETGESRGFLILWMGMIDGNECKVQERLKM